MNYPVFKGAGYILVHTPDMIVRNGSTAAVERVTNPDSGFLKEVNNHIRTYEEVVTIYLTKYTSEIKLLKN